MCRIEDGALAGFINVNEIVRGLFQSAFLGYAAVAGYEGRGYMREGLELVMVRAFNDLGLHRLEANIQPGNLPSIALVRGAGFVREGFSERYLKIGGRWRDHERWAIRVEQWRERGRDGRSARSRLEVAGAQGGGQRAVRSRRTDEGRAGRIEAVRASEGEREPGEGRAAPADRRAGAVGAEAGLDRSGDRRAQLRHAGCEVLGRAVRPPVEDEMRRARVALGDRLLPSRVIEHRGGDEHAGARRVGRRCARERERLDARESLVRGRRLELAQRAHLPGRGEEPRLAPGELAQLLGGGERPEAIEQPQDEVDLGLDQGVSSQTQRTGTP